MITARRRNQSVSPELNHVLCRREGGFGGEGGGRVVKVALTSVTDLQGDAWINMFRVIVS